MAYQTLGTITSIYGSGWQSFNPYQFGREIFLMQVAFTSVSLADVYSIFDFRYQAVTDDGYQVSSTGIATLEPDTTTQFFKFTYDRPFQRSSDVVWQVKRRPIFTQPSLLADVDISLGFDPDETF